MTPDRLDSSCTFTLALKPAHFVQSLRVSTAQGRGVPPIWRLHRMQGPSVQSCKQWYFCVWLISACKRRMRYLPLPFQYGEGSLRTFALPSMGLQQIHPMFLCKSSAPHHSVRCPEPGKVPGKVPGELQGKIAFHYACQVCGPSTILPRRGNLRKYVTAHSSASPFPSQVCTYRGSVPSSHLGWRRAALHLLWDHVP